MPVDLPDTNLNIDPEAWLCDSYEEAVQTLEDFITSGDFIPEVDARFEIFDDAMKPCSDQRMIEDLIVTALQSSDIGAEVIDMEQRGGSSTSSSTTPYAREEVIIIDDPALKPKPKEEPKKEEKVAKFDEIEIEDNR